MPLRHVPLVVVGCTSAALADSVAVQLRRQGDVVYVTHSADGCLRVAISVEPDMILLDSEFPGRVEKLLKAHPASTRAQIFHLPDDLPRVTTQPASRIAGSHAA
jgi:anthranilate phosphoribosyltransferase